MINVRLALELLRVLLELHSCHRTEDNLELLRAAREELSNYEGLVDINVPQ